MLDTATFNLARGMLCGEGEGSGIGRETRDIGSGVYSTTIPMAVSSVPAAKASTRRPRTRFSDGSNA